MTSYQNLPVWPFAKQLKMHYTPPKLGLVNLSQLILIFEERLRF